MGEHLYTDKTSPIREILQNSLDACRYRKSLQKLYGYVETEPEIIINKIDGESSILEIDDNGIGMNLEIIQNYLMRIGSSFYQSDKFNLQNDEFKELNVDFSPVSLFGIGILSSFIIADKIIIETSMFNTKQEDPLEVKIDDKHGYYFVTKGSRTKFGTKIKLFLKDNIIVTLPDHINNHIRHFPIPIKIFSDNKFQT